MPQTEFLIFEVLNYLLFAGCVWHASRQGKTRLLELLVSVLYGVFLEWMTIQQLEAYQYGHFLVMVDGAPLCIGLGWAVIIYSGMEFVRLLEMPDFARPFLVGFLALNLDLAMDVVAIRLGFWNWVIPLDAQWFGVPWGNFWAWYIVVVSYSGLLYWLRAIGWHLPRQSWRQWVYAPLAMVGSVVILALANTIFANVFAKTEIVSAMSMLLLLLAGMVVVYVARPRFSAPARLDWVVLAVPLVFHLYFNFIGFWNGYYLQLPVLAVVGLLMLAVGIGIHFGCWYFPVQEQKN
jgi:hypothetical protein